MSPTTTDLRRRDILFSVCGISPTGKITAATAAAQVALAGYVQTTAAALDVGSATIPQTATAGMAQTTLTAQQASAMVAGTWPLSLPDAAQQKPQWGTFDAQMRSAALGAILTQPNGARIVKVALIGDHEYAGGTASISHPWVSGTEKITVAFMKGTGQANRLVDVDVATLALTNERNCPGQISWMAFHFSPNPATPRIAYYIKYNVNANGKYAAIAKFDTATGLDVVGGGFPKDLSAFCSNLYNVRIQISDDERYFVIQETPGGPTEYVVLWDKQLDTVRTKTLAELRVVAGNPNLTVDEFPMMRNASHMAIGCFNPPTAIVWDLTTDALSRVPALDPYLAHQDTTGGLLVTGSRAGPVVYNPATGTVVQPYLAHETGDGGSHWSCQYRQDGVPDLDKWVLKSAFLDGQPVVWRPTWTLHAGTPGTDAIYRYTPQSNWFAGSGQTDARFDLYGFLLYAAPSNQYLWVGEVQKVSALGAIVADNQYAWDMAGRVIYVRPPSGLLLATTHAGWIAINNPSALMDAPGFVRIGGASSSFGKQVKQWFHHYTNMDYLSTPYGHVPRAQISQCGRFCLFTSNNGDRNPAATTSAWLAARPVGA